VSALCENDDEMHFEDKTIQNDDDRETNDAPPKKVGLRDRIAHFTW
jgi:hypothetical protein